MTDGGPLRTLEDFGALRDPVLVAAFVRKNGVNTTAAAALAHRIRAHDLPAVAEFDPQPFFDFTQTRPRTLYRDGERVLEWPRNRVHLERAGEGGRDALIVSGVEPHLRWGGFRDALGAFAAEHGVRSALIVRSFPAAVPHTRPVLVRLTTMNERLAEGLGLPPLRPAYEGPIDVGEVVASALADGASAGATAFVPNYLGVVPNPLAVLELTKALDRLLRVRTPAREFEDAAGRALARAEEQMAESSEVREAVRAMEEQYEALAAGGEGAEALPSADELLDDVERFLASEGDASPDR